MYGPVRTVLWADGATAPLTRSRVQARMRDINLHTISDNGTKSKDTFATIVQTAKKLGVNIYDYIRDRVSQKNEMQSLADIISGNINQPA